MADDPSEGNLIKITSTHDTDHLGQPREQLEPELGGLSGENLTFPPDPKFLLTVVFLCIAFLLNGLMGSQNMNERTVK